MRTGRVGSPVTTALVAFGQDLVQTGDRDRFGLRLQPRQREYVRRHGFGKDCIIKHRTPALPQRSELRYNAITVRHRDCLIRRRVPDISAQPSIQRLGPAGFIRCRWPPAEFRHPGSQIRMQPVRSQTRVTKSP